MIEYHSVLSIRQTAFQVFCQTRSITVHPYFPRRVSKKLVALCKEDPELRERPEEPEEPAFLNR